MTRRIGWLTSGIVCTMIGLVRFTAAQESAQAETANVAQTVASDTTATERNLCLSGVIILPDGKPAPVATVYLLAMPVDTLPTHPATTQTDDSGKYMFENVAPGNYRVWAELSNMTSLEKFLAGKAVEIQGSKDAESASDLAMHEGCCYAVSVIDKSTRKGIANAEIKFGWTDVERNYITDANGFVEIGGLAINDWYFVVQADDYAVHYRKIPAQPLGSRMRLTFEMAPGAVIAGTVLDEQGDPIAGASVHAESTEGSMTPGLGQVLTDTNGKYELKSMPIGEEIELSLQFDGFNRSRKTIAVPADQRSIAMNLEMKRRPPGGDCILTVTDEDGNPVASATITGDGGYSAEERTFTTDGTGVTVMKDLPSTFQGNRGGVRGKGLIPQEFNFVLGAPTEPGEVSVVLEKGESIRGRLVSPDGKPAVGIRVDYNDGEYGSGQLLGGRMDTDKDGRFQVDGLPNPSTFSFYTKPPFAPIIGRNLPVGTDEEITVTMEPEAVIRVRAVDNGTGNVIPEFNVKVQSSPDRRGSDPTATFFSHLRDPGTDILGAVKEFRLGHLPQGLPMQVTVSAKGYEKSVLRRVEATIESESDMINVELVREDESQYSNVSGVLKDSKSEPIAGATLRLVVGKSAPDNVGERDSRFFEADDAVQVHNWPFYNWSTVESGNIKYEPQCLQFLSTTTSEDGTFLFPRVRRAIWMELFYKGDRITNGRHVIENSEQAKNLESIEILAQLHGFLKVTVDRKRFPDAESVQIGPENERSGNAAVSYAYKKLPNVQAEVNFTQLPPGKYQIVLRGPREPLQLGRSLSTTTIEVMEGEVSIAEF